jgi:hypothetical protein
MQRHPVELINGTALHPALLHPPLARPGQPSHLSLMCFVPEQRSLALARPAVTSELDSEPDA